MNALEFENELMFKEERISYWEEYGCVLSKDGYSCDFNHPGVKP